MREEKNAVQIREKPKKKKKNGSRKAKLAAIRAYRLKSLDVDPFEVEEEEPAVTFVDPVLVERVRSRNEQFETKTTTTVPPLVEEVTEDPISILNSISQQKERGFVGAIPVDNRVTPKPSILNAIPIQKQQTPPPPVLPVVSSQKPILEKIPVEGFSHGKPIRIFVDPNKPRFVSRTEPKKLDITVPAVVPLSKPTIVAAQPVFKPAINIHPIVKPKSTQPKPVLHSTIVKNPLVVDSRPSPEKKKIKVDDLLGPGGALYSAIESIIKSETAKLRNSKPIDLDQSFPIEEKVSSEDIQPIVDQVRSALLSGKVPIQTRIPPLPSVRSETVRQSSNTASKLPKSVGLRGKQQTLKINELPIASRIPPLPSVGLRAKQQTFKTNTLPIASRIPPLPTVSSRAEQQTVKANELPIDSRIPPLPSLDLKATQKSQNTKELPIASRIPTLPSVGLRAKQQSQKIKGLPITSRIPTLPLTGLRSNQEGSIVAEFPVSSNEVSVEKTQPTERPVFKNFGATSDRKLTILNERPESTKGRKVFRVVKRLRKRPGQTAPPNKPHRKIVVKKPILKTPNKADDFAQTALRAAVIATKHEDVAPVVITKTQPIFLPPNVIVGAPQFAPSAAKTPASTTLIKDKMSKLLPPPAEPTLLQPSSS